MPKIVSGIALFVTRLQERPKNSVFSAYQKIEKLLKIQGASLLNVLSYKNGFVANGECVRRGVGKFLFSRIVYRKRCWLKREIPVNPTIKKALIHE